MKIFVFYLFLVKHKIIKSFYLFIFLFSITFLHPKTEVFFAPDDRPIEELVRQIDSVKKRLYGAIYMLSDQKVADALLAAHKRKVDVQVIVDQASFSKFGKADFLGEQQLNLFVYVPINTGLIDDIMHNKFALFDDKVTWCGSANWTNAANKKNQESVIMTDSKEVYLRFASQFKLLKERSISYKEYCSGNKQFKRSPEKKPRAKRTLDEIIEREYFLKTLESIADFLKSLFW